MNLKPPTATLAAFSLGLDCVRRRGNGGGEDGEGEPEDVVPELRLRPVGIAAHQIQSAQFVDAAYEHFRGQAIAYVEDVEGHVGEEALQQGVEGHQVGGRRFVHRDVILQGAPPPELVAVQDLHGEADVEVAVPLVHGLGDGPQDRDDHVADGG